MQKERIYSQIVLSILVTILCLQCDSSDIGLCFDSDDPIEELVVALPEFTEIQSGENILLVLEQSEKQEVVIRSRSGVIDDVAIEVREGRLFVSDDNRCNLFVENEATQVIVRTPDLSLLRNASQFEIRSIGTLQFTSLILVSDINEGAEFSIGDFRLTLEVDALQIISNNISNFFLDGTAREANYGFFAGSGRLEAGSFLVDRIELFHRGSNEMIVHPLEAIFGTIFSVGDVVSRNVPDVINVEERFTGRLRFE